MINKDWYVIYTEARSEKKLHDNILSYSHKHNLSYELYLPFYEEIKQWSDRKKKIKVPLFSNYLFVKHDIYGFNIIKRMPGFVDYIRIGQLPSKVPDNEMGILKKAVLLNKYNCLAEHSLIKGKKVKIFQGPLEGHEAILIENENNSIVAIEIKYLKLFLTVTIPSSHVQLIE